MLNTSFSSLITVDLHTQHTPNPNAQSPREIPPKRETKTREGTE